MPILFFSKVNSQYVKKTSILMKDIILLISFNKHK